MCDLCERPDRTLDDHLDEARELLRQQPFVVQSVGGSATSAESSYSIGLTRHGLPELIVLGLRQGPAVRLVETWARYLLEQSVVLPGEGLVCGPFVLEAVAVERPQDHLLLAIELLGPVRALQLVWADAGGRWPWQPGHRARRAGQPVLGRRSPWFCDEHRQDRLDIPPHL